MKLKKITFRRTPKKRVRIIKVPIRVPKKEELMKGIYIIPSLFTCANMAFGILSILSSINGNFIQAAWFLLGSLICDIFDGFIARVTKTTSSFGMQLDSLSDLVSFGVAPAIMMYMLVLNTMETIGIAIAVLFVLCSALRLARFNVLSQTSMAHKHFVGLPTPASAGVIISIVLSYPIFGSEGYILNFETLPYLMELTPVYFNAIPIVVVVLSLLMVSNIPYTSLKSAGRTKVQTIQLMAALIVLVILTVIFPQHIIVIIFTVYAASGLLLYVPRIILKKKNRKKGAGAITGAKQNDE